MAEGYLIGPGLRDAIKETITRVGEMPYRVTRNEPPSRFEDIPSPGQKLKRGTYTGSWAIGTTAVVTLVGSTQTYAVTNYCIDAEGSTASSASFNVVFGSVMGTQTAVEVESPPKDIIRACTFSGSWAINETKTLTFQGSTNTAAAWNQLFTIGDACTEQIAYIAKVPTVEQQNNPAWHLLNVQHHETAVITSVSLTTAAIEFTRIRAWIPYPGETATLSLPISAETACS
jgi:hypothetical protein